MEHKELFRCIYRKAESEINKKTFSLFDFPFHFAVSGIRAKCRYGKPRAIRGRDRKRKQSGGEIGKCSVLDHNLLSMLIAGIFLRRWWHTKSRPSVWKQRRRCKFNKLIASWSRSRGLLHDFSLVAEHSGFPLSVNVERCHDSSQQLGSDNRSSVD